MSSTIDVRAVPSSPGLVEGGRGLVRWVCSKNPFYVISALLVFLGLWISFGAQVDEEQTWALMFGLAAYTLLLAVPSCLLVRFGGVWQDVRTVLLLVVLMFLATSVTFDETLARSPRLGVTCYLGGLLFAIGVSEGLLRGMRLRLPAGFRVPYYLILGLFFLYPAALVGLIDRPRSEALEWALFGFPTAAGLVFLTLLPAVRRGVDYVRDNGSPWRWPLYPWVLFGFLGFGVAGRSFLLCWSMQHVARQVPEPNIFGFYFLVPFLGAIAVLVLEMGLVSRSVWLVIAALLMPAGLLVLAAAGERPDPLFLQFRALFIARLGATPLYLTLLAAAAFYLYAALRGLPEGLGALSMAIAALAVVGPDTLNLDSVGPVRPWPIVALGLLQLVLGVRRHSSKRCLFGSVALVVGVLCVEGVPYRGALAFHAALGAVLVIGAAFDDAFGRWLRKLGSVVGVLACLGVLASRYAQPDTEATWAQAAYPPAMAAVLGSYGWALGHRFTKRAAMVCVAGWLGSFGWRGYCSLRPVVLGLDYIALGLAMLVVAELISLKKAGLLRWPLWARKKAVPHADM